MLTTCRPPLVHNVALIDVVDIASPLFHPHSLRHTFPTYTCLRRTQVYIYSPPYLVVIAR
jgi:hypothetical protein